MYSLRIFFRSSSDSSVTVFAACWSAPRAVQNQNRIQQLPTFQHHWNKRKHREGLDADPTALAQVSGRLPRALGNLPRTWALFMVLVELGMANMRFLFLRQNLSFKNMMRDEA